MTCAVAKCDRPARTRGWCQMHYKRWWKTGDPLTIRPIRPPLAERFWARVAITESGCWEWTGARTSAGYGNVGVSATKTVGAHRVSWEIHNGELPDSAWVLHRCDNRPCVNPDHLFLGDCQGNVTDMIVKGRHSHGAAHWNAVLSDDQIVEIRSRPRTGRRGEIARLADEFGVSPQGMGKILRGLRREV